MITTVVGWIDVIGTGIISASILTALIRKSWREEHQVHTLPE